MVLTLLLGGVGGLAARALHLPLPMLLGPLLAVAAAAIAGCQPLGHPVQVPPALRLVFVPVIGVSIGAAFTPDLIRAAVGWWPSLLGLVLFIPLVHQIAYRLALASGITDRAAAWFGTAPGGLIETVEMGEAAGADIRLVSTLQFLRLVLTILLVPLGFTWLTGQAVGSGAGVRIGGSATLDGVEALWLAAAAVVGGVLGRRAGLPAGIVLGPVLASGLVHLAGLADAAPPGWLIGVTQVVVGVTLGVRFAGLNGALLARALRAALLSVAMMLGAAGLAALGLSRLTGEPVAEVFLAYAPGGLAEMSLIALSLHMSVIFVTAHHVLRIFLAVAFARTLRRQ